MRGYRGNAHQLLALKKLSHFVIELLHILLNSIDGLLLPVHALFKIIAPDIIFSDHIDPAMNARYSF